MLDIEVNWTNVAHGQSKPIERTFRTMAERVETKHEFEGAYCGNSTETRPEEWDIAKAVPVERLEQVLEEEIDAYNKSSHKGNGMEGKSPLQVYGELIKQPGYKARRISMPQLRLCAYSAVPITIRSNATFTILGASYWSEGTARLAPGKGYYARYNPRDLSDTVYVYRKDKLLCEATRKELTSFNDKAAGKEIMRKRKAYMNSVKQQAKALLALAGSDSQEYLSKLAKEIMPEVVDKETGEILTKPQVIEMVKGKADNFVCTKTPEELDNEKLIKEAGKLKEKELGDIAERYRKRALTK